MVKFALKYIVVTFAVLIVITICFHFIGEAIQSRLPDDGIELYPSREAAIASTRRGHAIVAPIEQALGWMSGAVIFIVMYRRHKAANRGSEDTEADLH